MKKLIKVIASLCALALFNPTFAADYPDRPIRLIVPFGPGQAADVGARIIAQHLSTLLHDNVIVENHPGAGGNIAVGLVAHSKPDGYTVLVGSTATQIINPALYPALGFKPDILVPVAYTGWTPFVITVGPTLKASSFTQWIAQTQHSGKTYQVATSSPGAEIAVRLIARKTNVKLQPISYTTSASAYSDVLGGRIPMIIDSLPGTFILTHAATVKALALTSKDRATAAPDIPTLSESGFSGFDLTTWNVFYVPAGTPQEIVSKLNESIGKVLQDPGVRKRLRGSGYEPGPDMSVPQVDEFVRSETQKWDGLIRTLDIKVK